MPTRSSSTAGAPGMLLISVLLGLVATSFAPVASAAESAYRYWSFWTGEDSTWSYATQGPATMAVADGDIHGWRFGVARDSDASAPQPQLAPRDIWQRACGSEPEVSGSARVAIVLDFGITEHAPPGEAPPKMQVECAVVDAGASGAQVLTAIADVRTDNGLVCAFDDYPATECAPSITIEADDQPITPEHGSTAAASSAVPTDAVAADERGDVSTQGNATALIIGAVVVLVAFVAVALLVTRKPSRRTP